MHENENELSGLEKSLNSEINELINLIEKNIKINPEIGREVPEKLREIRDQYESKNFFQYAEMQLGLARFLDFNLDVSKFIKFDVPKFINSIDKISICAWKIFHIYRQSCGNHEDGACVIGEIFYARHSFASLSVLSWPVLPFAHALSFRAPVKPIILPKDTILYRKIGPGGHQKGHWWMESKPVSQRQWRSNYAVLETWNTGAQCLTGKAKREIKVWVGKTAPQIVPRSSVNCYLKGGATQVWLDDESGFPLDVTTQ